MRGGGFRSIVNAPDEKPQVTKALLKRVLTYGAPYKRHIFFMLLIILITTGLRLLTPLIMRDLIDHTIPEGDIQRLITLAVALLILPMVNSGLSIINRWLNASVGESVIFDLRVALYSRLQHMSLNFFTNTRVGELMSRLNNDVQGAKDAISNTSVTIITNIIQVIGMVVVMASMQWQLTVLSIVILPLFVISAKKLSVFLRDTAHKQMESNAAMNAMMNETLNIGGALLVKLFGQKNEEINRFQERAADVRNQGIRRALWGSILVAVIGLVTAVGTALVYGLGGYFAIIQAISVGTIVAFGAYLGSLYNALQQLTNAPVGFATSMVSFERVFEVIDLPTEIEELPSSIELKTVNGTIAFENVSFKYKNNPKNLLNYVKRRGQIDTVTAVLSGSDQPNHGDENGKQEETIIETYSQARENALEEINFSVEPGQLVALVGPSGAGKTTLTYLIPRLYDPTEGVIKIDGYDLRKLNLESLSHHIGMVTQDTHLFHDTIRTNLLYANPKATQQEIETAASIANIHRFITDLPDGYDTIVGERGYRLSGGEKQRLALARVILKNPKILVLDEATSSLDSESESLIQEALKSVMKNRTSIVIAHRLSTILSADLILVMNRGKIVEKGKHAELLQLGGLYAHLYETQFKKENTVTVHS